MVAMNNNYPCVLLYHQVDTSTCPLINRYSININPKILEKHVKIIKESFAPISFEEVIYSQKENIDIRKRILLTFDDGYKAAVQNGGSILSKYDLCSIWFINSRLWNNDSVFWLSKLMWIYEQGLLQDFIERANRRWQNILSPLDSTSNIDYWAKDNYSGELNDFLNEYTQIYGFNESDEAKRANLYATPEEIKSLADLAEIGNHTASHPNVRNISLDEFRAEVSECHKAIQKEAKVAPECFAYPFGEPGLHWSPVSIDILKDLKYKWIFSVENKERLISGRLWTGAIPRYMVPTDITSKSGFTAYIEAIMQ